MRIPEWLDLRKPASLLALVAVSFLVIVLVFRWWDSSVEERLTRWAVDEVARQSDSTYRLDLGDLSFVPFAGSISFDSATVATDSARNRRRAVPLPTLQARAQECRVSGLDLVQLLIRRSFNARALACRQVAAGIALPPATRDDSAAATDTAAVAASVQQLVLPPGISSIRIAEVDFPALSVTLKRPGARGGTSVALERAQFHAGGVVVSPRAASADRARLEANGLLLRPDTLIEISAARLEADFIDSTLGLEGARHEPAIPEAEWARRVRVRRDRIRFTLDSLQGRGVAYRGFLAGGAIGIRALELHGARLDVLSDRRIPKGPPRRHRTPQQVAAQTLSPLRLDTVLVAGGAILYRERRPEGERPGVVSFEQVRATIRGLQLPSRGEPLKIEASARLMGEGPLTARATVPLDAPDFRYELSGRLDRMPAKALNRFLTENEAFHFDNGWLEEITFSQTVRGGRAVTTVRPRYRELSVEPTGEG
ncbi:MAG TPA: hypothetical protein VF061_07450, partial [Gemmatimonadales bacterium]